MIAPSTAPPIGPALTDENAAWDAAVHAGDVLRLHALIVPAEGPVLDLDHLTTQRLTAALRMLVNASIEHDAVVQDLLPRLLDAGAYAFDRMGADHRETRSPFEDALQRDDDRRARALIEAQHASAWGIPPWALRALVDHPRPEPARPGGPLPLFELALHHQWDNSTGSGPDQVRLWNAVLQRRPMPPETPDQLGPVQVALLCAMGQHRVTLDSDLQIKLLKGVIALPSVPGERKAQRIERQVLLLDTLVHDLRWHLPEHQATALLHRVGGQQGPMAVARRLIDLGASSAGMSPMLAAMEANELRQALRTPTSGTAARTTASPTGPRRRL